MCGRPRKVFGNILLRTDDYYGNDKPAAGAAVTLSGPSGTFQANTDHEGRYSFHNLEPGKYSIRAEVTGFREIEEMDWLPEPVTARGCQVANIIMRRTWAGRVHGRLIRPNGAPAPCRYRIVMNLYSFPTSRSPYPTIYWPAGRKEAHGLVIEVTDKPVEAQYDFQLPPEPSSETVEGLVVLADGTPAAGATVYIQAGAQRISLGSENKPTDDFGFRLSRATPIVSRQPSRAAVQRVLVDRSSLDVLAYCRIGTAFTCL